MSKYLSFDEINKHNWQDFFKHYANYRTNWKPITLEENLQLIETYQKGGKEGEKAINKLTKQYMAYISNLVKNYVPSGEYWGDFLQEGLLIFSSCLKTYDSSKGHPGPYVAKCVNNAMKLKLNKFSNYAQKTICANKLCLETIENEEDLYRRLFREEELNYEVKQVMDFASWSDREKDILEKSYGLNGQEECATKQIAVHHSLTRSRINQIKGDLKEDIKSIEKKRKTLKLFI